MLESGIEFLAPDNADGLALPVKPTKDDSALSKEFATRIKTSLRLAQGVASYQTSPTNRVT